MKQKPLHLALILTSLLGYLEWGQGSSMFLLQGEAEVLRKLFTDPAAAVHPFTIIPLLGQLLLLVNVFLKQPSKTLTWLGLGCTGVLLLFLFLIGIIVPGYKTLVSTLPFLLTATWTIRINRVARYKATNSKA